MSLCQRDTSSPFENGCAVMVSWCNTDVNNWLEGVLTFISGQTVDTIFRNGVIGDTVREVLHGKGDQMAQLFSYKGRFKLLTEGES